MPLVHLIDAQFRLLPRSYGSHDFGHCAGSSNVNIKPAYLFHCLSVGGCRSLSSYPLPEHVLLARKDARLLAVANGRLKHLGHVFDGRPHIRVHTQNAIQIDRPRMFIYQFNGHGRKNSPPRNGLRRVRDPQGRWTILSLQLRVWRSRGKTSQNGAAGTVSRHLGLASICVGVDAPMS